MSSKKTTACDEKEKKAPPTNEEKVANYVNQINSYLLNTLSMEDEDLSRLAEAMIYSINAGGKRIRPVLVFEFFKIASGEESLSNKALSFAAAVEMIHTYSLIHDDLPCMDNDELRRGLPTNHVMFGEATALLAGDALLTEAFRQLVIETGAANRDFDPSIKAVEYLSKYAGYLGMCAGQQIDLSLETAAVAPTEELILKMYEKKTSNLLSAACALGCIAAKRYDLVKEAESYGRNFGLAFQITDDILDVIGDEKKLGKPVGSDERNDKHTYIKLVGIEKAKERAAFYLEEAKKSIARFKNNELLLWLCDKILERDH